MAKNGDKVDRKSAAEMIKVSTRKRAVKMPALEFGNGIAARDLRHKLDLNQFEFWSRIGVTQSGGSRYESGRSMPTPTLLLLNTVYGNPRNSDRLLQYLRQS